MIKLVISAVNLIEGGTLQVLRDCVDAAARLHPQVMTTVLVHDRNLLGEGNFQVIEMPAVKSKWWRRIKAEYLDFKKLSDTLGPDVWLSLHDMTPNVSAGRQYVYCHNPSPFYKPSLRQMWHDPKFAAFNRLYGRLYGINISRNTAVIVQQEWLRQEFIRRYKLGRRVVTAAPNLREAPPSHGASVRPARIFLYPAFPRVFKNFEIICAAAKELTVTKAWSGEIRFTIDGNENRYARWISEMAASVPSIRLIGRQSPEEMSRQYDEADAVLFPSTLETWGLPVTEAKERGKVLLLADLPYAYTTLGQYEKACFLDPRDVGAWSCALHDALDGRYAFSSTDPKSIAKPDFSNWDSLMGWIVSPDE